MLKKAVSGLLLLLLFACSENPRASQGAPAETAVPAAPLSQQASASSPSLVFFLDPNGGPCRMQDAILAQMSDELKGRVNVRYVRTTVPSDHEYFYAFGVRGLPTLLLADAFGKEIKRLPPGVKSAEEIRGLLRSATANGRR